MSDPAAPKPSVTRANPSPGEVHQEMHRACLVCKRRFVSAWTGARLCDECRSKRDADSVERVAK
jgi:hypothetical protein